MSPLSTAALREELPLELTSFSFPWRISLSPEKHPLTVLKMSLTAWLKSSSEKRKQSEAEDEDRESTSSCSATSSTVTCDDNPPKNKKVRAYNSVWEKELPCERDFSSQNLIHTPLRSCLSIKAVETKMFIKHAVKHPNYSEQKLITDACVDFMAQKPRRLWLSTKVLVHKCHLYNVCWFFFFFFWHGWFRDPIKLALDPLEIWKSGPWDPKEFFLSRSPAHYDSFRGGGSQIVYIY